MQTLMVADETIPVLKSGLAFQLRLITGKTEQYHKRLRVFEQTYGISSEQFYRDFEAGKLGDDAHWFDWLFVYEAYQLAARRKSLIEGLAL